MKILVAEDDHISLMFLQKMLAAMGHDVVCAEDGREAWETFTKQKFKLVITDWMMPRLDGLALCRQIRQQKSADYVYIIILTAKDQKADAIKGLDAGADDYITKPLDPAELGARIQVGQRIFELEDARKNANLQLLQSEKMASVGQLAAGVAHEINNPTGFVSSNLKSLLNYFGDINKLFTQYRDLIRAIGENEPITPAALERIKAVSVLETQVDIDFILDDIQDLIEESREGTERIKKIVQDLKDFAHPGDDKIKAVDINKGVRTTLNVVWNELKYKAVVEKELADIPLVNGYPQQLNQVFMNILVNAAQAIEEKGTIKIATRLVEGKAEIVFSDTGKGIDPEHMPKLFDPFFTTKEIGKGTGLGLHVAYNIIQKHNGTIDVESEVGKGTTFRIRIPCEA